MKYKYKIISVDKNNNEQIIRLSQNAQDAIYYLQYFVNKVNQMKYYVIDIINNYTIQTIYHRSLKL